MKTTSLHGACNNCGCLSSPCWRRGPEYARHLCNACGSRFLVKGTLEGYKPGLKSRKGSKRGKARPKRSEQPPLKNETARSSARWQEHAGQIMLLDKGTQVDPLELEQMDPFVRLLPIVSGNIPSTADESSPESQAEGIKLDQVNDFCGLDSKESCEESMRSSDLFLTEASTMRKRARKPPKPSSPGW